MTAKKLMKKLDQIDETLQSVESKAKLLRWYYKHKACSSGKEKIEKCQSMTNVKE
jgi:hypothetical protein